MCKKLIPFLLALVAAVLIGCADQPTALPVDPSLVELRAFVRSTPAAQFDSAGVHVEFSAGPGFRSQVIVYQSPADWSVLLIDDLGNADLQFSAKPKTDWLDCVNARLKNCYFWHNPNDPNETEAYVRCFWWVLAICSWFYPNGGAGGSGVS